MSSLFDSFSLGPVTLANRVVMAPLTRARSGFDRIPNELMAKYYSQRASAGLIISEATVVSVQGIGWQQSPGIYNDQQVAGWSKVTKAVHDAGGKIFLQLWHCGRASHTDFHPELGLPVAPSALKIEGDEIHTPLGKKQYEVPRALETEEIPLIVADYKSAARRAKQAGFDGVEVHSANGYLLDQFLQSKTNQRTDRYGGSIEKRFTLLSEVIAAVQEEWDNDRVGVRLSPNGAFNDMGSPDFRESFRYVISQLDQRGLAYLHVMDGLGFGFHELGEPFTLKEVNEIFSGPVMGNCGYSKEDAEQRIDAGEADMIAFGRPYISNPDLAERFRNGWPLNEDAPMSVWYSFDEEGYADFPSYQKGS